MLVQSADVVVINLDKLTYAGNMDSLEPIAESDRYLFIHGDISDSDLVTRLLEEHQPDAVVNFAAETHVDRSIDGPDQFVLTNVVGTFRLLECTRNYWQDLSPSDQGVFRFLQVSTDEVYGTLGDVGKFTETTAYAPNSPYAASKASSDHFVRAFHHTYGLPVLTTNCSNNYGPYQFPEKLIPLMILNAYEGKPLPVYGNGQNVRDWLFVEDHCRAIKRVLEAGEAGEVYNIGANEERTNLQIVTIICDVVQRLCPELKHQTSDLITFVDDRPGHDFRYAIDASKIRNELGWEPSQSFQEGLEHTIRWYLNGRKWVQRVTTGKYRRERLGLANASAKHSVTA